MEEERGWWWVVGWLYGVVGGHGVAKVTCPPSCDTSLLKLRLLILAFENLRGKGSVGWMMA